MSLALVASNLRLRLRLLESCTSSLAFREDVLTKVLPCECPAILSTVSYTHRSERRTCETMNWYGSGLHTSESDCMRKVTGPDGVESLDPASPMGGQNLMKASHSHSSPLRSHFVHIGRTSSPATILEFETGMERSVSLMKHTARTFFAFSTTIQASGSRSSTFLACRRRGFIGHTPRVVVARVGRD